VSKSEEEGTAFDGVWLKPENEMPSKSSTLPVSVVVVFPSVASSLVSKGFPPSTGMCFTAFFATVLFFFGVRIVLGMLACVVVGGRESVDLLSGVVG
jgi:hypothetical protein